MYTPYISLSISLSLYIYIYICIHMVYTYTCVLYIYIYAYIYIYIYILCVCIHTYIHKGSNTQHIHRQSSQRDYHMIAASPPPKQNREPSYYQTMYS